MGFYIESRSNGMEKFDHLVDKVRRSVIFLEKTEADLATLSLRLQELRVERNQLAEETKLLNRQFAGITAENKLTYEKTVNLTERLEEFLGNAATRIPRR